MKYQVNIFDNAINDYSGKVLTDNKIDAVKIALAAKSSTDKVVSIFVIDKIGTYLISFVDDSGKLVNIKR